MSDGTYKFHRHESGALHEAGHAVIAVVLERKLLKVSIKRGDGGDGVTEHMPDCSTRQAAMEEVAIMLAGGEAADLWGFVTNSDSDEQRALQVLECYFPSADPAALRDKIRACVHSTVEALRCSIGLLAEEILHRHEIEGSDAATLIKECTSDTTQLKQCLEHVCRSSDL